MNEEAGMRELLAQGRVRAVSASLWARGCGLNGIQFEGRVARLRCGHHAQSRDGGWYWGGEHYDGGARPHWRRFHDAVENACAHRFWK